MNFRALTQRMFLTLALALMATGVVAATSTYQLYVDGLSCPFCAYGLEKKLGALPGVQALETRIKDGSIIVTMKDGVTLSEAAARQAVKEAGFSLRKLEQLPAAPQSTTGGSTK